eukprot:4248762-Pyramimonas_sp.AAC.1
MATLLARMSPGTKTGQQPNSSKSNDFGSIHQEDPQGTHVMVKTNPSDGTGLQIADPCKDGPFLYRGRKGFATLNIQDNTIHNNSTSETLYQLFISGLSVSDDNDTCFNHHRLQITSKGNPNI